ncbi:alpha-L-fucosidase [Dysgonomonas sp. PFB1-18]|uniref:alpha-L-fucosidase n=1 Tax=unclassified Dysgonomonas TaxID=2630389 RepID=UPI00247672E3|nr:MULTISPECIES: alpha-L-fucosidase [unclassified Dysgonomonas]MDH6310973.1 alpha-L-fucosidase [Dysgonomonas sp. PF1-14]MDH6340812.1 alpha-L-fucosidase [Dysgonomonas sp. PF1-16]MDH6382402.1 alpha-L-fucosidase [Dysgonomonas sp. PFB1-18]MDH6399781.1 alpha-L-fucosidase [Dysgonomonas sp. PF1-23]
MKKSILLILFCFIFHLAGAQNAAHDKKMNWWREARFGMFIHWGPYSILGGVYNGHQQRRGGAEWIMNRCKIPVAEYQQYASGFNPVKYDPESWVLLAKEAGMKYIVITAKHHDGFAMFKSDASKFNIVDFTSYNKDILDMLAKACRKHNMKLGFYYSQAQDWNNPGGSVARKVMNEGWPNPDSVKIDEYTLAHAGHWDPAQETRTMEEYIDRVSVPQLKELLSNYGDVAVIWWDTPTRMTDEFAEKLDAVLKEYPNVITNDRLKRPNFPGDYRTPEQKIPDPSELDGRDWETCMTMNSSWGYKSWDSKWKTTETLIRNLIDIASKGGNYLLNIGPTAEGEIPQQSIDGLKAIGKWMKVNGEAIYGTQKSPVKKPVWGCITRKDNKNNTTLFLSVFDWPSDGKLLLKADLEIQQAILLQSKSTLKFNKTKEGILINLPANMPDKIATVIKLKIKGKLSSDDRMQKSGKSFDILDEQ